jgi:hypothetical protein
MGAWILEELRDYPRARKVLGLPVPQSLEVTGENYRTLYYRKMMGLIARWRGDPNGLLESFIPNWESVPRKDLRFNLEERSGPWKRPMLVMMSYLKGKGSLEKVKTAIDLVGDRKDPVTDQEFQKELDSLSLEEFLELTS